MEKKNQGLTRANERLEKSVFQLQAALTTNERQRATLEATLPDCVAKLAACRNALVANTKNLVACKQELEQLRERENQFLAVSEHLEEKGVMKKIIEAYEASSVN